MSLRGANAFKRGKFLRHEKCDLAQVIALNHDFEVIAAAHQIKRFDLRKSVNSLSKCIKSMLALWLTLNFDFGTNFVLCRHIFFGVNNRCVFKDNPLVLQALDNRLDLISRFFCHCRNIFDRKPRIFAQQIQNFFFCIHNFYSSSLCFLRSGLLEQKILPCIFCSYEKIQARKSF